MTFDLPGVSEVQRVVVSLGDFYVIDRACRGEGKRMGKGCEKKGGGRGRDRGRRGGVLPPVRVVSDVTDSACRGEGKRMGKRM